MHQNAREGLIRAKGSARGNQNPVSQRRISSLPRIDRMLYDNAARGCDKVFGDGSRMVTHVVRTDLRRNTLNLAGVEDAPAAYEARIATGNLLLTGLLVFLHDGKGLPLLDERGLGTLFQVPSLVANLVESTPPAIGEATTCGDEGKVQSVSTVIHRARGWVVRAESRQVRFRPPKAIPYHVLNDLVDDVESLLLDSLNVGGLLFHAHRHPFSQKSMASAYHCGANLDFLGFKRKWPHRIASEGPKVTYAYPCTRERYSAP